MIHESSPESFRGWFRVRVPADPASVAALYERRMNSCDVTDCPLQEFEQIAQGISSSIQLEHRQPGLRGCFPVAFRIVADMQDLIWFKIDKLDRATENLRIGFVRSQFTRNENVRKIFGDAEVPKNEPQASIEI